MLSERRTTAQLKGLDLVQQFLVKRDIIDAVVAVIVRARRMVIFGALGLFAGRSRDGIGVGEIYDREIPPVEQHLAGGHVRAGRQVRRRSGEQSSGARIGVWMV